MGKSRVAPIKSLSIPRLELTAALVAAKLAKFIQDECDYSELPVYFWSDSMTVLRYLRNVSTRFKVFVAHRVQQIQELSDVASWNYVPTDKNPADHASRGFHSSDTAKLKMWLAGPPFLQEETKYNRLFEEPQNKTEELEVRQSCLAESVVDLHVFIGHFSSLKRLLKAVCWLRKFVQHLSGQAVSQVISVSDIESAKTSLVKFV